MMHIYNLIRITLIWIMNWPTSTITVNIMSLCMPWRHMGKLGKWMYNSTCSLNLSTRLGVSGQLHGLAALPPGDSPWYPFNGGLGMPQNQSGCLEEKNLLLLPGTGPWLLRRPAHTLVTTPTELSLHPLTIMLTHSIFMTLITAN